ncbi:hypothetical protein IFM89_010859 [Coptis chinensis]|uniref:GDSL esterase/lipase n=1 Tax=Coptis chinensis TaxID=261450 RepID=A0A835I304_9MAGN|nr:hypothetical protein IFM89_010859 [Coptis chinensis]
MVSSNTVFLPVLLFMFIVTVPCSRSEVQSLDNFKPSVPAILVFGDSTVDPGNNNYIGTAFRSDFPPYGEDFLNHIPTGRFTNGKLTTDYIASHLGIKEYVPPYLDITLGVEELMTGVSFASAGSGYDPLTGQIDNVITMDKQLEYFKEYKTRIEQLIGKEEMETRISKSVFIVSAVTNDFVANYFALPIRRRQYSITDYQDFLIENTRNFLQGLLDLGARKIGVVGVPPMGCLPIVITLNSDNAIQQQGCIESYTTLSKQYNQKLQTNLQSIMKNNIAYSGIRIVYGGIYDALQDIIQNYNKLGFEEWRKGCCGTGMIEMGFLCNSNSYVCPDRSNSRPIDGNLTSTNNVNHSIPAIFVFGDSTVDPGNNNFIGTILKSNFPPYGDDYPTHTPTGRFTNGKLTTDYIASYLGIKESVPPYLDNTLTPEELMTGVSFASAGSGYDQLTADTYKVIPMQQQLEYFKEYMTKIEQQIGKGEMEARITKSAFIVSAGTNDFVLNYFALPVRRKQYTITEYQDFLVQNTRNFIQALVDLGARKIGVVGVPPIGYLPLVMTLSSDNRTLLESYTELAKEYNQKLQNELQSIMNNSSAYPGLQVVYTGIFEALLDIIQNYTKHGFEESRRGCCGTGLMELGFLCNINTVVCPDRSKFIFWDSIHPTDKTYNLLFLAFRDIIDKIAKGNYSN